MGKHVHHTINYLSDVKKMKTFASLCCFFFFAGGFLHNPLVLLN